MKKLVFGILVLGPFLLGNVVQAATKCIRFSALPLGSTYAVGDSATLLGYKVKFRPFQWSSGTWTSAGHGEIDNRGYAGGLGKELELNNINAQMKFKKPLKALYIKFGEYGGNLNIRVNGAFRNFNNMIDLNGTTLGGVSISVPTGGFGNDQGKLYLKGKVKNLALGGQEFFIDDVCLSR